MIIEIEKSSLDEVTKKKLGVEDWHGKLSLDLSRLKPEIVAKLTEVLTPLKSEKGMTKVIRQIAAFNKLVALPADDAAAKAKTIEMYYTATKRILSALPSKRFYEFEKDGAVGAGRADAYYMEKMSVTSHHYVKGFDGRRHRVQGHIAVSMVYIDDRGFQRDTYTYDETDCFGKHPLVVLANDGLHPETPELKAAMVAERKRWREIRGQVGLQFRGVGVGHLKKDADEETDRFGNSRRSYWFQNTDVQIKLDKDGPAPLVIDVDKEGDEENDEDDDGTLKAFAASYWTPELSDEEKRLFAKKAAEKDDDSDDDEDSDVFEDAEEDEDGNALTPVGNGLDVAADQETMGPVGELPVHPWLTCFNLRAHQRVRLHMSQLTQYVYDTQMFTKLVIDTNSRLLIQMLLHQREQFKDVIAKKGGGAVILCAGSPGTGKTLTSEIFAESEKRPLYSVQCSQLGTSSGELEQSLLKIFARAARWKAILLLDEADVYIAKRGNDMNQNAIVGVFLRVLEYYNGVMFMTTNRAESVDDAVLSRCVARIDYEKPNPEDQIKIWHILAGTSGLKIKAGTAEAIANGREEVVNGKPVRIPGYALSGRDVKQILKLAGLVAYARKLEEIDVKVIEFCMRFKPTERLGEAEK